MKYRKAYLRAGTSIIALALLLLLLFSTPAGSTRKVLLGSATRSGPETIFLDNCPSNGACTENTTLGIEFGRNVYGIQVTDLDSDGKNDTSIMTAPSTTIGLYEVTTYECNATGCQTVAEKSFDFPYTSSVASGDKIDYGNVDNSPDGSIEWAVGMPNVNTAAGRPEVRVFRCGTNDTGWYGQNISGNGTNYDFRGATFRNQDLAFVVGDGGVAYRWDGGVWNWENLTTTNNTLDVDCAKSGETFCFAAGASGFVAYWNGTPSVWTKVLRPAATQVNRIFILNSTLGFAAVNTAAATTNIWKWDGTQWTTMTTPSAAYYTVSLLNDTFGWAGGSSGMIAFWNGATWSSVSSPTSATINSIDIWNSSFAFAGTSTGQILRYDGTSWAVDTTPAATAISRIRFFNGSYAKAILSANSYDSYLWTGGAAGTWVVDPTSLPRYGTWTDLAVNYGPNGLTSALAVGTSATAAKYANGTKKCYETGMSVDYYSAVNNVAIADIDDDGANELVATATTVSTTGDNNEFQVWNCTGGTCTPTYSSNHDSRAAVNALYIGDIDGDGATEVAKGMTATTSNAGTCGQNELCVMRCAALVCTNCGASCMINTALRTYAITYGIGLEANQPAQGRIAVAVDRGTGSGNDIMIYKMGVANGGSANTLTLSAGGLNVGTGSGYGQTVAYEIGARDYFNIGRDQLLAPWAWTTNYTFGIHECPDGTNACNFSSWFAAGVAVYSEKYRNAVSDHPYFTAGPSDGGSDQSSATITGSNLTFSGTATTRTGNTWKFVVCSNPDVRKGSCESHYTQYCSNSSRTSGTQATCQLNTTGYSGNKSWFAFACDSVTEECSPVTETGGVNSRPFFVNNYPSVFAVSITPSTPSTATNLSCNATLRDDVFASLYARVSWFKNGLNQSALYTVVQVANNTNTLVSKVLSGNLSVGESWYCSIAPYDGYLEGTYSNSDTVVISDVSPPSPSSTLSNVSNLEYGEAALLATYWTDDTGLSVAKLETNETGSLQNKTAYGSPFSFPSNPAWSNFTWLNSSVYPDNTLQWRIWANDSSNNWAATGLQTFNVRDTRAPKYGLYGDNNSAPLVGETILLYSYWEETFNLSSAKLETNETGTYQNKTAYGSPLSFFGTGNWSNFTWMNGSVPENTGISWRIWASDSKGNWNVTPYKLFTVFSGVDLIPPKYYDVQDNTTSGEADYGVAVALRARWQDNVGLGYAKLETNETGTYQNKTAYGSPYDLSGLNAWSNFSWMNDSLALGQTIRWRIWVNDSGENWNATPYSTFKLVDKLPPSPSGEGANNSYPDLGEAIKISSYWSENYQLSGAKLETNESGAPANYSTISLSGKESWSNFSWASSGLPAGTKVTFRIWANDTSGNWGVTSEISVTLVDSSIPSVRNPGINATRIYRGDYLKLSAQGYDLALDYAVLSTNETGSWFNYTIVYEPIYLGTSGTWTWSNFTWQNDSATGDVYWSIWYNDTSGNWNVTPEQKFTIYDPSISSSEPAISSCGYAYYQTRLYNSSDEPISANLVMRLLNPGGSIISTSSIPSSSLPAGIYCGAFLLPYGPARGAWTVKGTSSGVAGNQTFLVGSGGLDVWQILIDLSLPTYYSSENVTANLTIYNLFGEGIPGLASAENMSVSIDTTQLGIGNVTDSGAGRYNLTYPLSDFSAGSHYLEISANSSGGQTLSQRKGFSVIS